MDIQPQEYIIKDSEQQLKLGDVVRIKSDGPLMTITEIVSANEKGEPQLVACVWFLGSYPHYHKYPVTSLSLVSHLGEPFANPLKMGPMPNQAFRISLMEVALRWAGSSRDFLQKYEELLTMVGQTIEKGSLAFADDQVVAQWAGHTLAGSPHTPPNLAPATDSHSPP